MPPLRVILKAFDPERMNKVRGLGFLEGWATRKYWGDIRAILVLSGYKICCRTGKDVVDVVV